MEKIPKIGTAIIVTRDNKVLIGLRKSILGEKKYSFPWGHLDFWETLEEWVLRELFEETHINTKESFLKSIGFTEDFYKSEEKHYITFFFQVQEWSGDLKINYDEFYSWEWMEWKEIKSLWNNLFLPIQNLLDKYSDLNPIK